MPARQGNSDRPSPSRSRTSSRSSLSAARRPRAQTRSKQAGALKTLLIGLLLAIGSFLFGMLVISPLIDALHRTPNGEPSAGPSSVAPSAQTPSAPQTRPAPPPARPELQVTPEPGPAATVQQPETPDTSAPPPNEGTPVPSITATPETPPSVDTGQSPQKTERSKRHRRHPASAAPPISRPAAGPNGGVQQGEPIN